MSRTETNSHDGPSLGQAAQAGFASRRSERIMLTIPLLVSGQDAEGQAFECEASTVSVNRYGARIQAPRSLAADQTLRLVNLVNKVSSEFRVVGFVGEGENGVKEWGVETLDPQLDFWGIYFPPRLRVQPESTALLECSVCRTVGLLPLTLPEVEALDAGNSVSKFCYQCELETEWLYPDRTALEAPALELRQAEPSGSVSVNPVEASSPGVGNLSDEPPGAVLPFPTAPAPAIENRKERRRYVRRPIKVRDASGRTDVTRTENLSKNGVCLTSTMDYASGQEVTLIWPHPVTEQNYQARARVVRRHDIGGTARKIYGLEYVSSPALVAPATQSVRGLYGALAALVTAAAALLAPAAYRLAFSLAIPAATWGATVELSAAILVLYLGQKTWVEILRREAQGPPARRRRQRAAKIATAAVLTGAVVAGGASGLRNGEWQARALRLVSDLSLGDAVERDVDATEALDLTSAQDYTAACARLGILSREWREQLDRVSADLAGLRAFGLPAGSLERKTLAVSHILAIDREKLSLLRTETALLSGAARLPAERQLAYWQSNFNPLRQRLELLDEQRNRLVNSLAPTR